MLLIACPWCGTRPENEFRYGGEAHIARPRDPGSVDDAAWADFLYMRSNPKGEHAERWRHIHGCGRFFNCVRDTVSDRIRATYRPGETAAAMTDGFRTPDGGRIDRATPLSFSFDGKQYIGCHGDTLASALLANGVHLVGRSFKYHRPRGILSAGSEEPNALVTIDRGAGRITPNLRATQLELYDGMRARSQNRFPSLAFDLGAVSNVIAPLFPAGFYYKTFMWPRAFWRHVYEPAIRAAAGLGRAPTMPDPDRYLHHYAHCDVLVIGAGPAGLAAALAASDGGARVVLCDEQSELGGSLLAETGARIDGEAAADWLRETLDDTRPARRCDAVAAHHGVRLVSRQSHRPGGACHRSSGRTRSAAAARTAVACAGQQGGDRRRRAGTAAGVFRQRPTGRHAGRCRADLSAALRREGRNARGDRHHRTTVPMRPALRCAKLASSSAPSPICAATSAMRRERPACRCASATSVVATSGRLRVNRAILSNGEASPAIWC